MQVFFKMVVKMAEGNGRVARLRKFILKIAKD